MYELLSSYIFDLFNLLVRAADDYLLVPTRLLIQPMIGHRISSGVSDRRQKLVVGASRKGEHVKACRRLRRDDGCRCRARPKSYAGTPERRAVVAWLSRPHTAQFEQAFERFGAHKEECAPLLRQPFAPPPVLRQCSLVTMLLHPGDIFVTAMW